MDGWKNKPKINIPLQLFQSLGHKQLRQIYNNGIYFYSYICYFSKFSETGLRAAVKYFTDSAKVVLLLWIFPVFLLLCVCYAFVRVCLFLPCCHLLGKGQTSWLSFVVHNCEFVTFSFVSWVRCGT